MNFEKMKTVLFEEAKKCGLTEYDVYFSTTTDLSVEALGHELSSFTSGTSGGVGFRCAVGGRLGTASSQALDEDSLRALVARAMANADVVDSNEPPVFFTGAGDAEYRQKTLEAPAMPSAAALRRDVLALQERLFALDARMSDASSSSVGGATTVRCMANAAGLSLSNTTGSVYAFTEAVIKTGEDAVDGCAFAAAVDGKSLDKITAKATKKALDKLGATTVKTGNYNVIFAADQARQLLSAFASVFNGKNALMGLSLLRGKEGTKVAADCVTLLDDPFYPENPVQMPFDGEGVPTFTKSIIENGVLKGLLYDLKHAKKAGVPPTGNAARGYDTAVSIAPYCLVIKGGDKTPEELLQTLGDGLFVTELKGLHAGANAVTGDFSVESAGFAVRDGKLAEPVHSFTVAGNFFTLLQSVTALADNVEMGLPSRTVMACPDVLVSGLSVAGE